MFWIIVLSLLFTALVFSFFLGIVSGAPWIPTSKSIVRKMFHMADVKPGDMLYDLESGDGRIVVTAAREFLATSVRVEINPLLVFWTKMKVAFFRLSGKVNVVWGSFFRKDLSKANIVTLFLQQDTNQKLKPKLEKELKPGARVISHVFTFDGWTPQKVDEEAQIYMYRIP